ncbi:MAG: PD40 domain-containing protein [Phaeodactylibacter sp.]|nr:PD40 domain-containing protein [Phaeodactylibacter sp.]
MRLLILSLLASLVFSFTSHGQSLDQVIKVGNQSFDTKDYYNAFRCYEMVLDYMKREEYKGDWGALYIKYRYAEAAQRFNYFEKAAQLYSELLPESQGNNMDVYARSVFNLARVKQSLAEKESATVNAARIDRAMLEEAQELYQRFLKEGLQQHLTPFPASPKEEPAALSPEAQRAFVDAAKKGESDVKKAMDAAAQNPGGVALEKDTISRLPDVVNSEYSDLAPVLRGNSLYFSSIKFPSKPDRLLRQSRIYSQVLKASFSRNAEGELDAVTGVDTLAQAGFFNDNDDFSHTIHSAFTHNGEWMYFSHCPQGKGESPKCTLYRRKNNGGAWGAPEYLPVNVDSTRFTTTQPSIGYDPRTGEQWLYFASDRPGTRGGLDIWRCKVDEENGALGAPEPQVGVNSEWNDATPYLHALSGQLFFSSDRESTFGLYDNFVATSTASGVAIENLGLPYNSGYNDQYYFLSEDGGQAFFSSDRPESIRFVDSLDACCQDIYTYPIDISVELSVRVMGCGNDLTQSASLEAFDISLSEQGEKVRLDALRKYHKYRLVVSHDEFVTNRDVVLYFDGRYNGKLDTTVMLFPEYLDLTFTVQDSSTQKELAPGTDYTLDFISSSAPAPEKLENGAYRVIPEFEYTVEVIDPRGHYEPRTVALNFGREAAGEGLGCRSDYVINLRYAPCNMMEQFRDITFYFDNDLPARDSTYLPQPRLVANRTTDDRFNTALVYPYAVKWPQYKEFNLRSYRVDARKVSGKLVTVGNNTWYNYKELDDPQAVELDPLRYSAEKISPSQYEISPNDGLGDNVDGFFRRELLGELDRFNGLIASYNSHLSTGRGAAISLKAYCSIRGNPDYNKLLAKRRVLCIKQALSDGFIIESYLEKFLTKPERDAWEQGKAQKLQAALDNFESAMDQDIGSVRKNVSALENILNTSDQGLALSIQPVGNPGDKVQYDFSFSNEHMEKSGALTINTQTRKISNSSSEETITGVYRYDDTSMKNDTVTITILSRDDGNTAQYTFTFNDGRGTLSLDSEPVGSTEADENFPDPNLDPDKGDGGKYFLSAAYDRRVVITGLKLDGCEEVSSLSSRATIDNP